MNLDKVNLWLSLLANIGVVAGIIFVGIEISQNNRLLQLETSADTLENRRYIRRTVFENPEIAELWLRGLNSEELNDLDHYRIQASIESVILGIEWEYLQSLEGNLPPLTPVSAENIRNLLASDFYQEIGWEQLRPRLSPEFLDFVDNEILN